MKTLKKTLCLVLAMVMVFGLCVTSASAHLGYSDTDDITYKEAVDVMSGIGVLAGDSRGFRPTADITRAEAAKIIAYIMIGDAERADALKATSDPFVDVPASHWAAGYIAYCATAGIIAGMGDGYHPSDNVTGLQFAKMLLAALGYGVNGEYVGTDWAINVSRDALRLGMFEKNVGGANNNKATREECALYAFNTLAGAKDYKGIKKVSYSALLGGYIEWDTGDLNSAADANMLPTFAADFKLKRIFNELDPFGRDTGHHWIINDDRRPVISAEYEADRYLKANANGDEYRATFTSTVTGSDIYKLFGSDLAKDSTTLRLYINGTDYGTGYDLGSGAKIPTEETKDMAKTDDTGKYIVLGNFKKGNDKVLLHTGNGVQSFVYGKYDEAGVLHVKICMIDTYLAQVTRVASAVGNKDPETTVKLVEKKDPATKSGVNSTQYGVAIDANTYNFNTDEFARDEYVLVTIADKDGDPNEGYNLGKIGKEMAGEIVTMVPVITSDSEVTKYIKKDTSVSIIADGTTYVAAKNSSGDDGDKVLNEGIENAACITNTIVDNAMHTLYIDEFGYLIATSPLKNPTNYVYVAQFGIKINTEPSLTDKFNLMAHVYYADGTDEIVTVNTKEGIFDEGDGNALSTKHLENFASVYGDTFAYVNKGGKIGDKPLDVDYKGNGFDIGLYSLTPDGSKVILNKAVPTEKADPTHKDHYVDYFSIAGDGVCAELIPDNAQYDKVNQAQQYVSKGQATIDRAKTNNRANAKTVFFYVDGEYGKDDYKVVVYTGINSVPTVKYEKKENAQLSEYAYALKAGDKADETIHAVEAAVVQAHFETGKDSTVVYFFGGTDNVDAGGRPNFTKDNKGLVSYRIYGAEDGDTAITLGDENETRLEIAYKDVTAANKAISSLKRPGFVFVNKDGELEYVNKTLDGKVTSKGDNDYVDTSEALFDAGIKDDTVLVVVNDKNDDPEAIRMPLYRLVERLDAGKEVVVDLRDDDLLEATGGQAIMTKKDLFDLIQIIENNHDRKDTNNDPRVSVDGLVLAISFTGYKETDRTDVINAIYILDNVYCETVLKDGKTDADSTDLGDFDHISDLAWEANKDKAKQSTDD